jgi:transposase InsO family protein
MIRTALLLVCDLLYFMALACSTRASLAAENLFLRKHLAFYVERKAKPRGLNDTARIALVVLARLIDWRQHWNTTEHPTAEWTTQQFRSCVTGEEPYRFVVHDRDAIYSPAVDRVLRSMNLRVLKTPPGVPQANAFCERVIGAVRRECLDHLIPLNERHLRQILSAWVPHYNHGRPHASLGPGIPEATALAVPRSAGHQLPRGHRIAARPILGGLHHEYRLELVAA